MRVVIDSALSAAVSDIAAGGGCFPALVAQDFAFGANDQMMSVACFELEPWDVGERYSVQRVVQFAGIEVENDGIA